MAAEPEKKAAIPLTERLKEWLNKAVPTLLVGVIFAAAGLWADNIGNKRDIARAQWHNQQQDLRIERLENRLDHSEQQRAEDQREMSEFRGEALHRLDILLEMRERARRRNQR